MASSTDWDFSNLPDVVWVKILSQLTLPDRGRVSRTCKQLKAAFGHPTLWHTVKIVLLADLDAGRFPVSLRSPGVIMPERYTAMIRSFGAFFQNVHLIIAGHVRAIKKPCEEVITQLSSTCRLVRLVLEIGDPVNVGTKWPPPTVADLQIIASLIERAFRLRSLAVTSWPIYPNHKGYDILNCMRQNEKIKDLETLALFYREAEPDVWFPLNTCLPPPDDVLTTLKHFTQLTSVSLHADLITNDVIVCLATLKKFNRLGILLVYSTNSSLPHITTTAWKTLQMRHPDLQVEATIGNTLPSHEFILFFQAEIPLVAITFSQFSRYQPHILEHIAASYSKTVTKFCDFGNGLDDAKGDIDALLVSLVTRCTSMNRFIYSGRMHDSTILNLAELRGKDWKTFEVKLQPHLAPESDDEDTVIRVAPSGDVCVKAHQPNSEFFYTDESVQLWHQTAEGAIAAVSKTLQRKWTPMQI